MATETQKHGMVKAAALLRSALIGLVSWFDSAIRNTTFFICVLPFFIIGYVSHKITRLVVGGVIAGWTTSRDLEE